MKWKTWVLLEIPGIRKSRGSWHIGSGTLHGERMLQHIHRVPGGPLHAASSGIVRWTSLEHLFMWNRTGREKETSLTPWRQLTGKPFLCLPCIIIFNVTRAFPWGHALFFWTQVGVDGIFGKGRNKPRGSLLDPSASVCHPPQSLLLPLIWGQYMVCLLTRPFIGFSFLLLF